jgi:hypothetical protein
MESSPEDGVAEVAAGVDLVAVSPSHLRASDVSVGDEVGEDPLRGPFGDTDLIGDVARTGRALTQKGTGRRDVGPTTDDLAPAARFLMALNFGVPTGYQSAAMHGRRDGEQPNPACHRLPTLILHR